LEKGGVRGKAKKKKKFMLRLRDFILLAVLWSASSFILTNPSLSTTKHSFRPGHSPTPTITSFLLPPSPVLTSTSQSAPSRCSLFPLYSQIDPHRRSNRPSTIPATINLIVSTLKSAGSLSAPLDRATAANDAMTSHLAKLEADKNDVDAASIVLTDDEVVVMAGRVMQVVVRYEQLDNDLRRVVSKDESVGSWGKLWDAYGITNKPLFDGDEGGGVDDVAKMRGRS